MYFCRSTVAVTIIFIKRYQWTKPVSKEKVKTYLILTSFASQLHEAEQNSPLVLHGQPFALLPSFHEQTPLHLQLEISAVAEDIF